MQLKLVLIVGLGVAFSFLIFSKNELKLFFWILILMTFVREINVPVIGYTNPAGLGFLLLSALMLKRLINYANNRIIFITHIVPIVMSFLFGIISRARFDRVLEWLEPFLVITLMAILIQYFVRTNRDEQKLVRISIFVGFIFSFAALLGYLGFADGKIIFGGIKDDGVIGDTAMIQSRIYGISYNNVICGISALMIVLLPKSGWPKYIHLGYIIFAVFSVIISFKRLAVLATALSLAYYFWYDGRSKASTWLIAVIGLYWISSLSFVESIMRRFDTSLEFLSTGTSSDNSSQVRIDRFLYATEYFLRYPIFGAGAGRLVYVHNGFIEVLANAGLMGLLLFSSIFSVLKRKFLRDPWAVGLLIYFFTLILLEASINRMDIMYFWGIFYGGHLAHRRILINESKVYISTTTS